MHVAGIELFNDLLNEIQQKMLIFMQFIFDGLKLLKIFFFLRS